MDPVKKTAIKRKADDEVSQEQPETTAESSQEADGSSASSVASAERQGKQKKIKEEMCEADMSIKPDPRTLFVGNLTSLTEEDLHGYFSKYGEIVDVSIVTYFGKSKNHGFVTFKLLKDVESLMKEDVPVNKAGWKQHRINGEQVGCGPCRKMQTDANTVYLKFPGPCMDKTEVENYFRKYGDITFVKIWQDDFMRIKFKDAADVLKVLDRKDDDLNGSLHITHRINEQLVECRREPYYQKVQLKECSAQDQGESQSSKESIDPRTLLILGLKDLFEEDIRSYFSKYGEIVDVSVVNFLGDSKGLAFVTFKLLKDADRVLTEAVSTSAEGRKQHDINGQLVSCVKPDRIDNMTPQRVYLKFHGPIIHHIELLDYFSEYGEVLHTKIWHHEFVYVTFKHAKGAEKALQRKDEDLDGNLHVTHCINGQLVDCRRMPFYVKATRFRNKGKKLITESKPQKSQSEASGKGELSTPSVQNNGSECSNAEKMNRKRKADDEVIPKQPETSTGGSSGATADSGQQGKQKKRCVQASPGSQQTSHEAGDNVMDDAMQEGSQPTDKIIPSNRRTICIDGVTKVTEEDICSYFSVFGDIVDVSITNYFGTPYNRGFVTFKLLTDAEKVLKSDERPKRTADGFVEHEIKGEKVYCGRVRKFPNVYVDLVYLRFPRGRLNKAEVKNYFSKYGEITDVLWWQTKFMNIRFSNAADAEKVLEGKDEDPGGRLHVTHIINGQPVECRREPYYLPVKKGNDSPSGSVPQGSQTTNETIIPNPCTVLVKDLKQMTEEDLQSYFSKYGTVVDVTIVNQKRRSKGYGYVTFKLPKDAKTVIRDGGGANKNHRIMGQQVECQKTKNIMGMQPNAVFLRFPKERVPRVLVEDYFSEYGEIVGLPYWQHEFMCVKFKNAAVATKVLERKKHHINGQPVECRREPYYQKVGTGTKGTGTKGAESKQGTESKQGAESKQSESKPGKNMLFLYGIGDLTEQDLRSYFCKYGKISYISARNRDVGLVRFRSAMNAAAVMKKGTAHSIKGETVYCQQYKKVEKPKQATPAASASRGSKSKARKVKTNDKDGDEQEPMQLW